MSRRTEKKRFLAHATPAREPTELAKTLYKIPALVAHRVRCGKPGCHCAIDEGHGPYWFLHWRDGPVQRRRYVRARDVPGVRAILETRRAQRRAQRLGLALALRSWRELGRMVDDYEARLRAVGEDP